MHHRSAWLALACALLLPLGAAAQDGGATGVIVAPVRLVEFADTVTALGTTRANESVEVTANVTEKIVEIRFDDGQRVEQGDVLVVLERAEELAALEAAKATLAERKTAFERSRQLEQRQFAARATLDERRAALEEAQADLEVARARLADRVIKAPFPGVVGLRNVSVGRLVEPGDVITTLDDLSRIKLDFAVPSAELAALRPGLAIVARTAAFGDRRFAGEVAAVDTQVDPVTRSVTARALVPNQDGALRPGLLMSVELRKNPRRALVVPEAAIVPRGDDSFVFLLRDGDPPTVERRRIAAGARRPGEVEVLDGLEEGQRVVTEGTLKVRDGAAVEVLGEQDGDTSIGEILSRGRPADG